MAKAPSFQFYAADYLMSTLTWKPEERGCYISLLAHEWVNGSLPNDLEELAAICNTHVDNFNKVWERKIKGKFIESEPGKLINERLEKGRAARENFINRQSINGKKGGRPKNPDESQSKASKNPEETQPLTQIKPKQNPNKSHLEDEDEEEKEDEKEIKEGCGKPSNQEAVLWPTFEDYWDTYDKKIDKPICEKKWNSLKQREKEAIMDYLPSYVASTPEKKLRKNPETFLNRRAWENEIIDPIIQNNGKQTNNPFNARASKYANILGRSIPKN